VGGDPQNMPGLQVAADLDGEPGVADEPFLRGHGSGDYTRRPFTWSRPHGRGSVTPMLLSLTTTGKVTLIVVAAIFIVWALVTAMWIPKRNPPISRSP